MTRVQAGLVGTAAFAFALTAALSFESVYRISARDRPTQPLADALATKVAPGQSALPLRLVDSGGVGIPTGDWGKTYSHDRRTFRDVILEEPPYVNQTAFARVEHEWQAYVDRMRRYGNTAVAVPLFLELVDFDRVPSHITRGVPVYSAGSAFRARHAAVRHHFGRLFEWARTRGMLVFLDTDMLALTPPLTTAMRRFAPASNALGIDTRNPAVWTVYRAALEEVFDAMPSIAGVVVRFGEGGALYNTAGWPYESQMAIRTRDELRAMLHGLLPAFESRGLTLVLRSWTVGVGRLGKLHTDPNVYNAVLGDIDSPSLVVSTKYTAGDFFSYLPLNETLTTGGHRRIIELQAKPEFEGFGAFADFLGEDYARALRVLSAQNRNIAGTYVLAQFGGPLRAGPRMLYPLQGFWLWTDLNVFVASQLSLDRGADVTQLARQWAAARFGPQPAIVDAIAATAIDTRDAVLKGFYIRPFAEREVRVPGLELPPLMWIFEWDMVGGWHSLLSLVYYSSRDAVEAAIREGHDAVATIQRARQRLKAAVDAAGPAACSDCASVLRSLEYQETLFAALAAWRQAFLSYYQWLDTGDPEAWQRWREGRAQFDIAAARHAAGFAGDLEFPAFNLSSARNAVAAADRAEWARWLAASLVFVVAALLGAGYAGRMRVARLMWVSAVTPWRLHRESIDVISVVGMTAYALLLIGVLAGTLTAFSTLWLGVGSPLVVAVVALAFESTAIGLAGRSRRGHLLAAVVGPLIPGITVLLALIAYLGPIGFWYSFWTSSALRITFLTVLISTLLWTASVMFAARAMDGWRARVGSTLAATGAGLVTLTALLPNWIDVLRFLDRPLNFAPATDTMLFALRAYAGVRLDIGGPALIAGAILLGSGFLLSRRAHRATF